MTWLTTLRHLVCGGLAAALLLGISTGPARGAAIVTTDGGSNQILIYPATPEAVIVSGVPADAHPHGVSCFDDTCLVSDQGHFRIFVVRISTASVVDTIGTNIGPGSYSGAGTLAVNPAKTFALALDPVFFTGSLSVIPAPFVNGAVPKLVPISGSVSTGGTQAIVFQATGRAFICTGGSIAVLDSPYTAVAFKIPLDIGCGELALSPDGNTLFAPIAKVVSIFKAPFTASSTPDTLSIPAAGSLAGVAVTSDNAEALVVDSFGRAIWTVSAPFGAASAVQKITLAPEFGAFRQIAISSDDELAILAGGSGTNPNIAFISSPFTTSGAVVSTVVVPGGVGFGGVNILGPANPPPPPPPCGPISAAALTLGTGTLLPPLPNVGTLPLFSALLPTSRSVRVGCPATAFVTVINAGTETATGVGIALSTLIPADFLYQTTNPTTNALTGAPNTPIDVPAGQAQTYVVALTPRAAIAPTEVAFTFGGTNTAPVAPVVGLNTLLFSASNIPVPDIVALAATIGNTGITRLIAAGAGAFAVASVNVGLGAAITVTADTGTVGLPVILTICQTNPGTGLCLDPPASTVTTFINGGATPTFAIFGLTESEIAFNPGVNRVFVRFRDSANVTRGATSVAVTTARP
jgi:hypothetical protein